MMKRNYKILFPSICFLIILSSCEEDFYLPKPQSYFRIDLPEKEFEKYGHPMLPFTLDLAKYSALEPKSEFGKFDIVYPLLKARIHCTYFELKENELPKLVEECYNLAYQHNVKATAINSTDLSNNSSSVHGRIYELKGNAASPIQFYMTDSTSHFMRGSLYFNTQTNADSLAPVTAYLKNDIESFFQTLTWR